MGIYEESLLDYDYESLFHFPICSHGVITKDSPNAKFKRGDKVYSNRFGKGVVQRCNNTIVAIRWHNFGYKQHLIDYSSTIKKVL